MKLFWTTLIILSLTVSQTWGLLAKGVFILGDTGQAERMAAMAKQLAEATKQLNEARKLVRTANTLVQIAGDPKSVITSMSNLSSASRQLDQILGTPTTREFRKLVNANDSLTRSQEYFNKEVGNSFLSGKKQVPRKANLYRACALAESSYDSFDKLVSIDKTVQQREAKRQEKLTDDLVNAKTQAEVDKINAAIAASKSAQDASSHQIMKQKMEIDVQKMAMETERQKIQTARNEERRYELMKAQEKLATREEIYKENFNEKAIASLEAPSECELI